ncbi:MULTISPECIES: pilin [Stutzerimonas stutzeri subgroup]|jgi:type IV pilus assembly protein PilA|uniref:pilin n=1 Tax=Stutzerimonas stutzeri subgroup TaxID=578833 RepID=UPI0008F07986|nr:MULTISPECIES: pilin [Stutzerimonas stutzeri subgroup]MBW8453875.1 pilin [Pseudomonas sp.]MCQ2043277.1 pilin [Stutzerimonas kunmingensis]MDH0057454.1 pilin [Stutzerimonas stutzeri]SFI85137.1 type IV pilus assembly protein PilA [Stutzerimonas kunmingensis]
MKAQMQKGFTLIELMIVVAIIGILAAIAIPQYQNYVGRSNVASAVSTVAANKTGVESFIMNYGAFPDGTTAAAAASGNTPAVVGQRPEDLGIVNPSFGVITLHPGAAGAGKITLTFSSGNPGINTKKVSMDRTAEGTWTCVTDVDAKFIDKACTAGTP